MVRHTRESGAKSRAGQEKSATPAAPRPERVAKALARAGIASRREVERLISLGKVAVNGRILESPAVLVTRDDVLTVEGKVVNEPEPTRLWRYHKPVGLVTTHKDPEGRPTVFEHLPEGLPRVLSVGRLDLNSEGLLLLTNDGELARALEMPATGWPRRYRVRALGSITQQKLDRLQEGISVDGVHYGSIDAKLDKVKEGERGANVWITVTLTEGKNREIRKVFEALGLKVNRLMRLAYGPFQLGTLEDGAAEEVGPRVIRELLADFIAPENLPTGDRTTGPLAAPGRRPAGGKAAARLATGNALADPTRKPSRVRAQA
ncbi:pseudouridine synthase, partial [Caulobacter sp. 17J65-9]|uniref:pseudouridine synthase n=1 Tax=Caulobacter sp. 17J65-9 TaxID=2709382 RepID=UPI0013C8F9AF